MKKRIIYLICMCQVMTLSLMAQEQLKIQRIFDKFGKKNGSILVLLSTDILSQGKSDITLYKSLMMEANEEQSDEIYEALKADLSNAVVITEVKKNGLLETGTYYITPNSNTKSREYILYKHKGKNVTLVYLTGHFKPEKLDKELNKLKDLFIYVNNKRIKVQ